MPVLAREIEAAGVPTVTVSMMPVLSEKVGASRILGVQFPFGHSFGPVRDREVQTAVLHAALEVLVSAAEAGTRVDMDIEWPGDANEWYRRWQPAEPSPIVKHSIEEIRRARRESAGS